jgi:hypothetical protein
VRKSESENIEVVKTAARGWNGARAVRCMSDAKGRCVAVDGIGTEDSTRVSVRVGATGLVNRTYETGCSLSRDRDRGGSFREVTCNWETRALNRLRPESLDTKAPGQRRGLEKIAAVCSSGVAAVCVPLESPARRLCARGSAT